MAEIEDTTWLERLRRREHDAFAELVQKHQRQVFLCCCVFGLDGHEAGDVASETFLAAWKSIASFNGKAKLSTWLWSIAYHKAMDSRRQQQPIIENIDPDGQIATETNQSHMIEIHQRDEILWSAVKKLPQPWPLVVVLFYREDKSIAEISAIMDIPENTVKIYLHRARNKLKESLVSLWRDESQCA